MIQILETNDERLKGIDVWIMSESFADRREGDIGKEKADALRSGKVVFLSDIGQWVVLSARLPVIC